LLFVLVMEAVSYKFRIGLSLELLYADNLAVADTGQQLVLKLNRWKDGLEKKGMKVSIYNINESNEWRGSSQHFGVFWGLCHFVVRTSSNSSIASGAWPTVSYT